MKGPTKRPLFDNAETSNAAPNVKSPLASSPLPASSSQDPLPLSFDLNIPIVHRKGTRNCTQKGKPDHPYPISTCVSYSSLPNSS